MAAYRNNTNVTGHAADVADVDMQEHVSTVDHTALQHSQPHGLVCYSVITGSIVRSANLPVFSLLRGRF